ncbi:MAG: hypothetical protein AABX52_00655 [Nanoarchaeota archaeon]
MIVGFNFTKMLVERKEGSQGKIAVNNNVAIKSVEKLPLQFGKRQEDALRMNFEFQALYEPKLGEIFFEGYLVWLDNKDAMEAMLKSWQKDKKLDKVIMNIVLNNILAKCNVEAIILSRDINLPPSVPMPRVQVQEGEPTKKK